MQCTLLSSLNILPLPSSSLPPTSLHFHSSILNINVSSVLFQCYFSSVSVFFSFLYFFISSLLFLKYYFQWTGWYKSHAHHTSPIATRSRVPQPSTGLLVSTIGTYRTSASTVMRIWILDQIPENKK